MEQDWLDGLALLCWIPKNIYLILKNLLNAPIESIEWDNETTCKWLQNKNTLPTKDKLKVLFYIHYVKKSLEAAIVLYIV